MQQKMAELTNLEQQTGTLADAMKGADIFVGVSAPGIVTPEMVASMNKDALEGRAAKITEEMKLAAANAIASLVPDEELNEDNIMPEAFNPRVAEVVAEAVRSHIER